MAAALSATRRPCPPSLGVTLAAALATSSPQCHRLTAPRISPKSASSLSAALGLSLRASPLCPGLSRGQQRPLAFQAGREGSGGGAMAGQGARRVAASLGCPAGYRANVGICLVNRDNRVFVASRIDKPGAWQMPQGGIDAGEDPMAAARRELKEETGVTSADLVTEVPDWLCYDFPPDVRAKLTVAWGKEWQGQAQKWFLFRFTGVDESEITLAGDGSERPEFEEWKWMDAPLVIQAAVDFKRPVYEAAFRAFDPYLKK